MTVLIDINHPSHSHVFNHLFSELEDSGYKLFITSKNKEYTHRLLKEYKITFINTGNPQNLLISKILKGLLCIFKIGWLIFYYNIDVVLSMESPYAVIAAWICGRSSITIADTETAGLIHRITGPLSTVMIVPECFQKKISQNQVSFKGYKELAYLHPDRFRPDKNVLAQNGIQVDKPYAIIRFVAFRAMHDRGHSGFSNANKMRLVTVLSEYMDVYITSEIQLPLELEKYKLKINPADIHHIMAFASLFAGESMTMSAEAAVLGVPAICLNEMELGYISELADKYGLIFKYNSSPESQEAAIEKALELIRLPGIQEEWQRRRDGMLEDKIDVTSFLLEKILLH
ncbi:MAG: DUF354 domain-containing protein [Bacteroidales bacterium]|nr:DUF354 domain-containing protein [Bacteroidales bacterium]